jgi:hypothetical protein
MTALCREWGTRERGVCGFVGHLWAVYVGSCVRESIPPPPHTHTTCSMQYRWNIFKNIRNRIDQTEGGLDIFSKGEQGEEEGRREGGEEEGGG